MNVYIDKNGYVREKETDYLVHRIIAEKMIGRPLKYCEVVHHINGNKRNNSPSNLEILNRYEHLWIHRRQKISTGVW